MKITYDDGTVTAEISVMPATVRMGLERSRMISEAEIVETDTPYEQFTRKVTYPSLIAASPEGLVKVDGKTMDWPPTFDQFLELPEALGNQWFDAVQSVNAHWFELPEPDEKKVKRSSKGR